VGVDGGVEARGHDALVLGQEVVGVLVEVADPTDHGRPEQRVVAVCEQLLQELDVLRFALHER
jgi:hypothetical protein